MQQLNYPTHLVEVIVIDDFSDDATVATVKQFSGVKVIELKAKYVMYFVALVEILKVSSTGIAFVDSTTATSRSWNNSECHRNWSCRESRQAID